MVNYILLVRIKRITFNIYFLGLILFFIIHAAITYTVISIPYNFMLSQIIGITIVGTYYYNFIALFNKEEITKVYIKMCLYVSIIGYFLLAINYGEKDYRLMSIFKEPAHYVIVVIPACYYYLKNKKYVNFGIIFGTLVLSNSSLGYIGCGLMFLIPYLTLKRIGSLLALLPILFVIFFYVYKESPLFKLRVDDTYNSLNVINTGKFDRDTNLSSYVMISNIFIAKNNIEDHPLGSGIGSHHYMHTQRYLKLMRPPEYLKIQGKEIDNSFDANSLFTRILSEFGLLGFILICFVLYKSSKCFDSKEMIMSQGIFLYFLLKLFRDGHYFPPELFFFIWLFYYSISENITLEKKL